MGFSSAISSKCVVIDDDNAYRFASHDPIVNGVQMSRGWQPRDFSKHPFGSFPFAERFDLPLIPESEWIPRIEEAERNKTHLRALAEQAGLTVLDQNGTVRFKRNAIVVHLLENGGIDMNAIARLPFDNRDREQFAQLIGYSVNGFGELG